MTYLKKLVNIIPIGVLLCGILIADSENILIPCAIILLGLMLIGIQYVLIKKHQTDDEEIIEEAQIDYGVEFENLYHQYGDFPLPDADELLKKLECDT